EQWLVERACDGFVVSATHVPGAYEDFVRFVVPELQRRGLFRTAYAGKTLRENLRMPIPPVAAWRGTRAQRQPDGVGWAPRSPHESGEAGPRGDLATSPHPAPLLPPHDPSA